ncbi:MAG: hypothetical protein AB8B58_09335 [Roseobacter sp.]
MTMREAFEKTKYALERGQWLNRQSLRIAESSEEMIRKSRETIAASTNPKPTFTGPKS